MSFTRVTEWFLRNITPILRFVFDEDGTCFENENEISSDATTLFVCHLNPSERAKLSLHHIHEVQNFLSRPYLEYLNSIYASFDSPGSEWSHGHVTSGMPYSAYPQRSLPSWGAIRRLLGLGWVRFRFRFRVRVRFSVMFRTRIRTTIRTRIRKGLGIIITHITT